MDRNETTEVVMSQEAHTALVEQARAESAKSGRAEGVIEGRKAAHDRISAIVSNEKVKGKVETALDLALKSPDMSADDVVAFVAKLPAGASPAGTIEQRMNGQGEALSLGLPMQQPNADKGGWNKAVAAVNKRIGA